MLYYYSVEIYQLIMKKVEFSVLAQEVIPLLVPFDDGVVVGHPDLSPSQMRQMTAVSCAVSGSPE